MIRWSPEGDSLDTRERHFRVKMADAPGDFDGNTLLGMELQEEFVWGRSSTEYFTFDFQSSAPIADGGWLRTGGVQSRIQLSNGDWVSFQGQAEASGEWRGNAQDNKGQTSSVRYNADGSLP